MTRWYDTEGVPWQPRPRKPEPELQVRIDSTPEFKVKWNGEMTDPEAGLHLRWGMTGYAAKGLTRRKKKALEGNMSLQRQRLLESLSALDDPKPSGNPKGNPRTYRHRITGRFLKSKKTKRTQ